MTETPQGQPTQIALDCGAKPCAVDLGSGSCGFVAMAGPSVVGARVVPVPPAGSPPDAAVLAPVVEELLALAVEHGATVLVLEIGWLYGGGSPQAVLAVARHHETCAVLSALLSSACARLSPPIPTHTIARRTWAGRLVPGVRGVTSEAARAVACAGLDEASLAHLADDDGQHKRDALGALRGWLLGAPVPAPKAPRVRAPKAAPDPAKPKGKPGRKKGVPGKKFDRPTPAEKRILAVLQEKPRTYKELLAMPGMKGAPGYITKMRRAGFVVQQYRGGPFEVATVERDGSLEERMR